VAPDGTITTVAGNGASCAPTTDPCGDGGPATSATFTSAINGVAQLPDGSVLVADSNGNRVRKIDPSGVITTVAGTGAAGFGGDGGPAAAALLNFPVSVSARPDGSFLIGDNDNNRVRLVAANGTISTAAGTGAAGSAGDGGPATSAQLNDTGAVATTPDGGFLVTEILGHRVRRVAPDGTISTVAGTGTQGSAGDGGPATSAQLNGPDDVSPTPDGGFVIADTSNHRIRKVSFGGTITTLAGTGTAGYNGDDIPADTAQLNSPYGLGVTSEGDVLIVDGQNFRIRFADVADAPPPPPPPNPPASVTLDVDSVTRTPGDANTVNATVLLRDGSPAADRELRYSITGANPGNGIVKTDANGVAAIAWNGVHDGTDTLTAWADLNGDTVQDPSEPADSATVQWVLPTPVVAKTVNIEPVKGKVLVKLPAGASRVHGAASGFIPLEEARTVPVGSIVDTRKGTVQLTSAANRLGATQASQFWQGDFLIRQAKAAQPVTELVLNEALTCTKSAGRVVPARARSRSLWGKGKGRFRTRGRNSSASVRGTTWFQKDTCNSTRTVVREGVVTVHDFAKHTNVTVKAGHSYIARPKKRR
jgi:hypothetical protein